LFLSPTREPEKIIGTVNFTNVIRGPFQACYLGYGIDQLFERQGLMREALETSIAFAFDELHLHRIMANYLPSNERSARLLAHLGFVREGEAKDYLYIQGAWRSHILSSLTNPRWSPRAQDQKQFFPSKGA
jgi:ribosomal-protein-alanine N-acetyltransferase